MDRKSHLADLGLVTFTNLLLPSKDFSMGFADFPAINCIDFYKTQGDFFASYEFYQNGKLIGSLNTEALTEQGQLAMSVDEFSSQFDRSIDGMVIIRYRHTQGIPITLYFSAVHRETGIYASIPSLMYMGDEIYQKLHTTILENTLFWPGATASDHMEPQIAVINPYKTNLSYEMFFFDNQGERLKGPTHLIKPFRVRYHNLEEEFPEHSERLFAGESAGKSVCVAAQYKLAAYGLVRDRQSGAIVMIDHLHPYRMV